MSTDNRTKKRKASLPRVSARELALAEFSLLIGELKEHDRWRRLQRRIHMRKHTDSYIA